MPISKTKGAVSTKKCFFYELFSFIRTQSGFISGIHGHECKKHLSKEHSFQDKCLNYRFIFFNLLWIIYVRTVYCSIPVNNDITHLLQ